MYVIKKRKDLIEMSRASEIALRRNVQQARAKEERMRREREIQQKKKEIAEKNKG